MIAGIVSEYNPFHLGHAHHLRKTKEKADAVVAVMSGNFVQRGDIAAFEKHARAEAAVRGGADLVLEIPTPWACAPAETFAEGALYLLRALGCVDLISFGSESDNPEALREAAEAADSPLLRPRLKALLDRGLTFAKARERAVAELFSPETAAVLRTPNDTLGVEYLRAARRLNFEAEFMTVRRIGPGHDAPDTAHAFAGASAVRTLLREGRDPSFCLPPASRKIIRRETAAGRGPNFVENLEIPLISRLRMLSPEAFAALPDLSEGLENRLYRAARTGTTFEEVCAAAKTKRYPLARIRRLILAAALGMTAEDLREPPPYLRVLAVGEGGREILRRARKTARLPLVMRKADIDKAGPRARRIFELECAATDFYTLAFAEIPPCGFEQRAETVRAFD